MTGPEHYREAERLLAGAVRHITEHPADMRIAEVSASAAQVHTTLALAAATAALVEVVEDAPCCDLHKPGGCCDPEDCGPCCGECPTCPTLARQREAQGGDR